MDETEPLLQGEDYKPLAMDEPQGAAAGTVVYGRAPFWRVLWAYFFDWVAVVVIGLAALLVSAQTATTDRFFLKNDTTFMYPYEDDTVSSALCAGLSIGVPLAVAVLVQIVMVCVDVNWWWFLDMHHFILGGLEAGAIMSLVMVCGKHYVGRLRPSAFSRETAGNNDFEHSYPSGHTSTAFTGFTFLALYLSGKFGLFSNRGVLYGRNTSDPFQTSFAMSAIMVLVPLGVAVFIGFSRIVDYAHDPSDVNAGVLVGFVCASIGYFSNFPSIFHANCNLARPLALSKEKSQEEALLAKLHRSNGANLAQA